MRLLFFSLHGDGATEIALLCRGAGVSLDIAGMSSRLVKARTSPAEQIHLRTFGVGAPTDEEICDTIRSGGYSAVIVSTPLQVVQFRNRLQPLRRQMPLLVRHSGQHLPQFQQLRVLNFMSPSPRALAIMRSCHTL